MKKLWIVIIAAAILIPTGIWWFSTEQVIMRRTKHLMEVLSLNENSALTMRQAKVFSMNAMLAPEVELSIPAIAKANGTFEKQEMESAFSWICQNAKESRFTITEFKTLTVTGSTADVHFSVEGFLDLGSTKLVDGKYDVTIRWRKGEDGWRFERVVWKNF